MYAVKTTVSLPDSNQASLVRKKADVQNRSKISRLVLPAVTLVWLGMIGIGMAWMWQYEVTPGEATTTVMSWPTGSQIERSLERPTLVLFAHPRCPCTRATIRELALIVARCPDLVDIQMLFFRPTGFSAEWEKTDLWSSAEAIPGVTVVCDVDGTEAKRFKATTSGYSLLYNTDGRLLFHGGITGSRGHSGDNVGRSAIESLLRDGETNQNQNALVFGCPLLGQEDVCGTECRK
ncbi:MAG: RedB protein [Blastopirellula sp.]|nr:MAG: RedB protein [Blastopirellula sp.]